MKLDFHKETTEYSDPTKVKISKREMKHLLNITTFFFHHICFILLRVLDRDRLMSRFGQAIMQHANEHKLKEKLPFKSLGYNFKLGL